MSKSFVVISSSQVGVKIIERPNNINLNLDLDSLRRVQDVELDGSFITLFTLFSKHFTAQRNVAHSQRREGPE